MMRPTTTTLRLFPLALVALLIAALTVAFACGRARVAPLAQNQAVCSEGAMKVYHKAGGPGRERGDLEAPGAHRQRADPVERLKGQRPPGTWADTWSGAGCD